MSEQIPAYGRKITINGKQLGKEDVYLDLSKLSEELRNSIEDLLKVKGEKTGHRYREKMSSSHIYLIKNSGVWWRYAYNFKQKTEISHSQFLELMGETKPKYRFKTLEEFDKEFKKNLDGDYILGKRFFPSLMFHLAGVPIQDKFSEQIMNNKLIYLDLGDVVKGKDNHWLFTPEMLTLNEPTVEETTSTETSEKEIFQEDGSLYIGEGLENYYIDQLTRTRKYFVFPKAPEGDFPDLSDFSGYKMIGQYGTSVYVLLKQGSSFMLDSGKIYDIRDLKPIQPELIPEEIVEKLGKDFLLNLIKEKENERKL